MRIVHGTPNSLFAVGVGILQPGAPPMPFIAFAPKGKMGDVDLLTVEEDCTAMVKKIEEVGGVVIFFDNPESFASSMQFMRYLGHAANEGEWGQRTKVRGMTQ
jgi:hypothetical protein